MIAASGLDFGWGAEPLIQGLELEVAAGEVVALVGRSGCGKSTLLRLLAGLLGPAAGSLRVDGRATLVFQDARLLPWLSVRQNAELALEAAGVPREAWRERVDPLLAEVGLAQAAELRPAALSGGMAQRAALVRALALHPELLLLDEPFGALDALLREELQGALAALLRTRNAAVVLVTHDIEEALVLADRVFVMRGRPAALRLAARSGSEERMEMGWRSSAELAARKAAVRDSLQR